MRCFLFFYFSFISLLFPVLPSCDLDIELLLSLGGFLDNCTLTSGGSFHHVSFPKLDIHKVFKREYAMFMVSSRQVYGQVV